MAAAEGGGARGCPALPLANGRSIPVLGLAAPVAVKSLCWNLSFGLESEGLCELCALWLQEHMACVYIGRIQKLLNPGSASEFSTSHQGGYSHDAVVHALQKCGIRHIDTAKRYGCESLLQKAIKESGVKREELWITTKLWHSDYGYENTKKACLESCERLGVEYLDLYLIHWPDAHVPGKSNREVRAETWTAMEELYEKGLCRSIGVSNFLISHLEQLKEDCVITPHVNQVEYHPFQRPQELVDYCRSRDIVFEGYCPLAKGEALIHPSVIQLAKKYGRTPAQICIRWSIQNGIVTIPKSTKAERIQENCKVFDFAIAEDDVEILNGMHDGRHVSWDPSLIV
ncbi:glyoxal reductase-like isoform X2 [Calonectris borealis]|uniref:glyoxal reductase-like isoform X2 n=1 Tax=Calonectris borealis TaxID=1323832 RepID=UPI003F4B8B87